MNYFPDTNHCIFYLNKASKNVVNRFDITIIDDIKISAVVAAELLYGASKSARKEYNLSHFRLFLQQFEIVPFDDEAAEIYGTIRAELERSGKIIGGNDLVIAATVIANSGILATNNVKEFSRIDELKLEDWTR